VRKAIHSLPTYLDVLQDTALIYLLLICCFFPVCLVSVSFTRLCRGITISFIFEKTLEFCVDKLIIHVYLQRPVNCGWYTGRYGSGQESRQTEQVTVVQRRRSWESTSLHKALWWGMSLTVLGYGSLPKQYIAPNASHISSASGTKEFLGTEWEYYVRNTSLWVMWQESPLSSNLTYKGLWQMCVSKVAYIGYVPDSRFCYKKLIALDTVSAFVIT
jgi:hypothetical protein